MNLKLHFVWLLFYCSLSAISQILTTPIPQVSKKCWTPLKIPRVPAHARPPRLPVSSTTRNPGYPPTWSGGCPSAWWPHPLQKQLCGLIVTTAGIWTRRRTRRGSWRWDIGQSWRRRWWRWSYQRHSISEYCGFLFWKWLVWFWGV